ncbi:MAG: hypothetical protein AAGF84_03550 [Planctomycetota bacterium]
MRLHVRRVGAVAWSVGVCVGLGVGEAGAQPLGEGLAERRWTGADLVLGNNDYNNPGNWLNGGIADGVDEVAVFGADVALQANPRLTSPETLVGAVEFRDTLGPRPFTFEGPGALVVRRGIDNVSAAAQVFNAPIVSRGDGPNDLVPGVIRNETGGVGYGALVFNGSVVIDRPRMEVSAGAAGVAFNGPVTGGQLRVGSGVGAVTLRGDNTFNALQVSDGGRVVLEDTGRLADFVRVSVGAGGRLRLVGVSDAIDSIGGDGEVRLEGGAELSIGSESDSASGSGSVAGTIGGDGRLIKRGDATQFTLIGVNTYTGGTRVEAGRLAVLSPSQGTGTGPTVVADGARLRGTGALAGVVTIESGGTLAPGVRVSAAPSGTGDIEESTFGFHDLTLEAGARVEMDIVRETDGTTAQDQILLSGVGMLDGGLSVDVSGSVFFSEGERLTLFESAVAGGIQGTFDTVEVTGLVPGVLLDIEYLSQRVDLVVTQAEVLAGDYNFSGRVEQGDLNLVLSNWGQERTFENGGEPFATDVVDQEELNRVLSNWGSSNAPSFAGFDVPEPAGLGAVWIGALSTLTRRRMGR